MIQEDFTGRRVLLTGALSAMGMATARLLAARGMRLALVARRERELQAFARETGAEAIVSDLGEWGAATAATLAGVDRLGGLDAVVNCAGITISGTTDDLAEADWQTMLAVNLTGPIAICRAALGALREGQDPAIVNIASAQALLPPGPITTAYAATKGGLVTFTRSLALEAGPLIRVNALCPGAIASRVHDAAMAANPEIATAITRSYALKRIGVAEEIAQAVLFLATPLSSFITGAAVPIDGGRTYH